MKILKKGWIKIILCYCIFRYGKVIIEDKITDGCEEIGPIKYHNVDIFFGKQGFLGYFILKDKIKGHRNPTLFNFPIWYFKKLNTKL